MKRSVVILTLAAALLGGCAAENTDGRAAVLQGKYAAASGCSMRASVSVVNETETLSYTLDAERDGDKTRVTVLAPEALAGVSAVVEGDDAMTLEYGGVVLAAHSRDKNVSAANAVSVFLRAVEQGCVVERGKEAFADVADALRLCFEWEHAGETLRVAGWFDGNDLPLYAEIERDGEILAYLEFTDFAFDAIIS